MKHLFVFTLSALLILFAGGAQVASHFCNGIVVAKSFNLEVEKCKKDNTYTPFTKHPIASKSACCDTQISFAKSSTFEKFNITKFKIQSSELPSTLQIIKAQDNSVKHSEKLRPPLIGPPLYILMDRFLI